MIFSFILLKVLMMMVYGGTVPFHQVAPHMISHWALNAILGIGNFQQFIYITNNNRDIPLPLQSREIYSNHTLAISHMREKADLYSRAVIVVIGRIIWIEQLMEQVIRLGLLSPSQWWILVPEEPVAPDSFLTNGLLTNQYNLILMNDLTTGMEYREDKCKVPFYTLEYSSNAMKWKYAGCVLDGPSNPSLIWKKQLFSPPAHLNNFPVSVGIVKKSPELRIVKNADGNSRLIGFPAEVLWLLQKVYKFSYSITFISGYGNKLPNGSWIGLVGATAEGKLDIGLASLSMNYERHQVVDFTEGLIEDSTYLMFLAKDIIQPLFIVFQVFTPMVWLSLVIAATLLAIAIQVLSYGTSTSKNENISFASAIGTGFSIIINQGILNPTSTALRLAYLSGLILGLIIFATYSGNLTAFLSIPRLQSYPRTAHGLLDEGYSPILTRGFSQYDYFKYSPLKTLQELFLLAEKRKSIYPFGRINHEAALARFKKGKAVSIISATGTVFRQNAGARPNEQCAFFVEPTPIVYGFSHFILKKNSPLKPLFSKKIIWLRDHGVLKRISEYYNAIPCVNKKTAEGNTRPLALTDLQGAFLLWIAGVLLATFCQVLEQLQAKIRQN